MATKPTISQIADMSGASVATVLRSINSTTAVKGSTTKKIMEAIHSLNYPSPENFITTSTEKDGKVILINIPSVSSPFYNDVVEEAQDVAPRHDYYTLVSVQRLDSPTESTFLSLLDNINPRGAIMLNAMDQGYFNGLYHTIPFVQCCGYTENQDLAPCTSIDDVVAVKTMMEYILSIGHTKIALLYESDRYKYARQRKIGYIQTLEVVHVPLNKDWIIQLSELDFDMVLSSICQLMSRKEHLTAVSIVSNVLVATTIRGYCLVGLFVPSDIIVTGLGNVNISQTTSPPITTISQPKYQMGYIACELLIEKLDIPGAKPRRVLLSTEFIVWEFAQRQRAQHQDIPSREAYFEVRLDSEGRLALAGRS